MRDRISYFAGSRKLFWIVVGLLVVQAAWIALSSRYPMAFDEEFHYGITQIYANQWNPFLDSQPEGADQFRVVFRDPSYLFHYLMSFPYRVISLFTDSLTVKVVSLRFINIALFAWGLVLYRRLLGMTGISPAIVNLTLLAIVLLPVTSLLAAHINYDNLIIPLTALVMLATLRFKSRIDKTKKIDFGSLLLIANISLFAMLVKYTIMPVLLVIGIYVFYKALTVRKFVWHRAGRKAALIMLSAFIILSGLFFERYGLNFIHYQAMSPECSKVLSVERCSKNGVWIRNYQARNNPIDVAFNPLAYSWTWLKGMWLRTFFSIAGPEVGYQLQRPLPMPGKGAIVFGLVGLAALITGFRKLLRKYDSFVVWLFVAVSVVYVAVLWAGGFSSYLTFGRAFALNGRYLLPILPLLIVLAAAALHGLLGSHRNLKLAAAAVPIACLLWGGGVFTYILRSNDSWYWPGNDLARNANHAAKRVIGPVTPGYQRN